MNGITYILDISISKYVPKDSGFYIIFGKKRIAIGEKQLQKLITDFGNEAFDYVGELNGEGF